VTINGSGFSSATGVTVSGTGVGVTAFHVVSDTQITATFNIAANAGLGNHNVTVVVPGGNTGTLPFTVQGATLTSISPTTGLHNTTVPVTLNGSNLSGATAVTMNGGGITCSVTGSTATTISANCSITNGAAHTARNVTATTPAGTTNTLNAAFTVN
jgi:hypothetical protein